MAKLNNVDNIPVLPVLASTMLQNADGGSTNDEMKQLILGMLRDQAEARATAKANKERQALSGIQAQMERDEAIKQAQDSCSHLKQDNSTRLAGQRLTGTKQIALVCQFCTKSFYMPPDKEKGQEAPPRHLVPSADVIGNY